MTTDTIVQFDFSEALALLKQGKRVRRLGWGETSRWLELREFQGKGLRFSIEYSGGSSEQGCIGAANLLATDWVVVDEDLTELEPHYGRRTPAKLDELIEKIRRT